MKVVVAPDKFKGSVTAVEAADAIALGVLDALPGASVVRCPVADGGEGTLDVLASAGAEIVSVRVSGPLGDPVDASYAVLDGCAYVESARACGIEFVTPSPAVSLCANTYGVGELIAHALSRGVDRLVLTVGGTASTDGGAGMLQALGAQVFDGSDAPIGLGGGPLREVSEVDLTPVLTRLSGIRIGVATDVTNPLLGPSGAAAVFGPQKGASPDEVASLEEALTAWARALHVIGADVADIPGSGAGGGIAAAALALGASVESGFDLIVGLTGVESALAGADLVITGEGSLDPQSLAGKAPAGIARRAKGIPLLAIAGRIALDDAQLTSLGVVGSRALIDHAPSLDYALANTPALLRAQAADLVRDWSATP